MSFVLKWVERRDRGELPEGRQKRRTISLLKLNSLVDTENNSGHLLGITKRVFKIRFVGFEEICSLRLRFPGRGSERISSYAVLGRTFFLEHSKNLRFENGGQAGDLSRQRRLDASKLFPARLKPVFRFEEAGSQSTNRPNAGVTTGQDNVKARRAGIR